MTETKLRRRLAAITAAALSVLIIGLYAAPANADGDGSPDECKTPYSMSGDGDLQTYHAPEGWLVTGVCIKAGQLHTGPLGDQVGACYTIAGVGTRDASVERTGTPGPDCQGLSHVDVLKARAPETTTTTAPTETTTTEPEETTTTTVPETTTTTVPETTTTTVPETTTTTAPTETTTTEPEETTTTTVPEDPSTTAPPELPFTGPEDDVGLWLSIASALVLSGLGIASLARRDPTD